MKRILAYGPSIRSGLEAFIEAKRPVLSGPTPLGAQFLDRLKPFVASGKLLRGSVLCFAYEAFGGQAPDEAVIRSAMALELTHSALLIHDDIMDDDGLRRGQPSMHRQYLDMAEAQGLPDAERLGVNLAMSGADGALFMAFELLGEAIGDRTRSSRRLFTDQLLRTCLGQMQDVYFEAGPSMPTKRQIHGLMRSKTASYTMALPLGMGAALAGQPEKVIRRAQTVGMDAGTIFQIRDDELGVMGDPSKTGKPAGSDIIQGKKTLLLYYLEKRCDPTERERIRTIFGNPDATGADMSYVRSLVRRRITDDLAAEIGRLRSRASTGIGRLPMDAGAKRELGRLVDFCARRQF